MDNKRTWLILAQSKLNGGTLKRPTTIIAGSTPLYTIEFRDETALPQTSPKPMTPRRVKVHLVVLKFNYILTRVNLKIFNQFYGKLWINIFLWRIDYYGY